MSERGYDSDAQSIPTPKQTKRSLLTTAPIRRDASPLGRTCSVEELDWLGKPFHESTGNEPHSEYGDINRSQIAFDFLGHERWSPSALQTASDSRIVGMENTMPMVANQSDSPVYRQKVEPPAAFSKSKQDENSTRIGVAVSNPPELIDVSQEINDQHSTPVSRVSLACQDNLIPERYSGSLGRSASQLVVTKRRKQTTREPSSEVRSVHLTDMNISKMLASPSISPRVLSQNQSLDESGQRAEYTSQGVSDQYHNYGCQNSQRSLTPGKGALKFDLPLVCHSKNPSSFYSRMASLSSAASGDHQAQSLDTIDHGSLKPERRFPSAVHSVAGKKSKFTEHFDLDRSNASVGTFVRGEKPEDLVTPRKVSIGWMSGGRRLGYGYTLISESEEGSPMGSNSPQNRKRDITSNRLTIENIVRKVSPRNNSRASSTLTEAPGSVNGIPNIIDRISLRNLSSATACRRATNTKGSTDVDSENSSLWARLAGRKDAKSLTCATDGHDSKLDLSKVSEGGRSPHDNELAGVESKGGFLRKYTEIPRSESPRAQEPNTTGLEGALEAEAREIRYRVENGYRCPSLDLINKPNAKFKVKRHRTVRDSHLDREDEIIDLDHLFPHEFSGRGRHSNHRSTTGRPRDGEYIPTDFTAPIPDMDAGLDFDPDLPRYSEQAGSDITTDDWASLYQDCLEILSDRE
ncbi:hypothetical protein MW887_010544 [Aspergillus wentii]|nr:hypothetical protein MW887_010544 [Aspergillus wentii]